MSQNQCRFCEEPCEVSELFHYHCLKCGTYNIEQYQPGSEICNKINYTFDNNKKLIKMNIHNIRGYLNENETFTITSENLDQLIHLKDIKPLEKLKKLLLFLYTQADIGEILHIEIKGDSIILNNHNLILILWAKSVKEVSFLIDELANLNYIETHGNSNDVKRKIRITTKGFEYIDELETKESSDIGFCAMWFARTMEDAWNLAIHKAIENSGYSPRRIDFHDHNNVILEEIEGLIRQSKFIIADLTGHRCGVYFEAGIAKSLGKTIIYTCEENDFNDIHFDIKHFNCLKWNRNDLENFKNKLQTRIENTLGKGSYFK